MAPAYPPVKIAEVRTRLRIDVDEDESDIVLMIAAATDHVEKYCNTPLALRTVEIKCDSFADMARLPVSPVGSIESISYVDAGGSAQTVPADAYELRADGLQAAVVLRGEQSWPTVQTGSRITVTAKVGYSVIPPAIKHAILLYIGDAYSNRENAVAPGWTAFDSLLSNYRRGV